MNYLNTTDSFSSGFASSSETGVPRSLSDFGLEAQMHGGKGGGNGVSTGGSLLSGGVDWLHRVKVIGRGVVKPWRTDQEADQVISAGMLSSWAKRNPGFGQDHLCSQQAGMFTRYLPGMFECPAHSRSIPGPRTERCPTKARSCQWNLTTRTPAMPL